VVEPTYKERRFIAYYVGECNGNASGAARKAGYAHPATDGYRLLRKPYIHAAVEAKVAEVAMSADEVLARVSDIASATFEDFLSVSRQGEWRVNLRRARDRNKLHVLKKLKSTKVGTEIEIKDSLPALIRLGEYHGLWTREQVAGLTAEQLAERLRAHRASLGDRGVDPVP
jgi:hypothetical protein